MITLLNQIARSVQSVWDRFNGRLVALNARQVDAWGASLQYKRRYTNPDAAKRYRQSI